MPPAIQFIGTGEAADPELPNASLLYRGGRTLLVDCGYSVPQALWRLERDPHCIDGVYVTHIHGDHSFGLPGLVLWMGEAGRTKPLTFLGGPGFGGWLRKLLNLAYPGLFDEPPFPLELEEVAPGKPFAWGPLQLRNAPSQHGVRNLSVRIEEGHRSVCVSGDGAPTDETRALYHRCTVLVHDTWAAQPGSKSHAHLDEVLQLAQQCGVEQLFLWHLGTRHKATITARAPQQVAGIPVTIPFPGQRVQL